MPRQASEQPTVSGTLKQRTIPLYSIHLGHSIRIDRASAHFVDRLLEVTKSDLSVRLGEGVVYLFSFGSAVFAGVEEHRMRVFLEELKPFVEGPTEQVTDDFLVEVVEGAKEQVYFDRVILSEATPEKMKIVALVLAQSTTLEYFEGLADQLLSRTATITDGMTAGGRIPLSTQELIRFIGMGLGTQREIVSRLSILDSPEVVWEDVALDSLHQGMKNNFELTMRFRSLEYRLRLIRDSAEVLVDLNATRRAALLEMTIIFLIALDIVIAVIHWLFG
jgi:uncharacterized Rmd1/YagE family protein